MARHWKYVPAFKVHPDVEIRLVPGATFSISDHRRQAVLRSTEALHFAYNCRLALLAGR